MPALLLVWSLSLVCMQDDVKLDEALQKEIANMVAAEQKARFAMIDVMKKLNKDAEAVKKMAELPEMKLVAELDAKHTKRMKEIVAKHGWPGKSLVGVKGSNDAWLLVQHADQDREFQKQCLKLLEEAVKKNEADKKNLAYLMDRVLCAEDKKQVYGTQLHTVNGELVPKPIEDEGKVDERRKEAGLSTMTEYLKQARTAYGK